MLSFLLISYSEINPISQASSFASMFYFWGFESHW